MDLSADQIAGIVDLFGALTQEELSRALAELAFKRGEEYDEGAFATEIAAAVESYKLVRLDPGVVDDEVDAPDVLAVGPVAFPELPEHARDLAHILEVEKRTVNTDAGAADVVERFESEAEAAIDASDSGRKDRLVDVSYEIEAWAGVDVSEMRQELLDA